MFANAIPGKAQVGQKIIISGASERKWYKDGEIYTVTGHDTLVFGDISRPYYKVAEREGPQGSVVFEDDALIYLGVASIQRSDDAPKEAEEDEGELTGGSVSYYMAEVKNPTTAEEPYMAECNDIIEALQMNYAEANVFKAIWRSCAARLGKRKKGQDAEGVYDAEKMVFFSQRVLIQRKEGV